MYYKKKQDRFANKEGKRLWRPVFVRNKKIVNIRELARWIAEATTLTVTDVVAVLLSLPAYMNLFMKDGATVRLDGLGTFHLKGYSRGNGVETPEKVNANQFNQIVCRFTPEYVIDADGTRTRTLGTGIELTDIEEMLKHAGIQISNPDDEDDGWRDPNA